VTEIVDPIRKFMINGQVYTLATQYNTLTVSNNQSILAAVSTQRHRVMGIIAQTNGATPGVLTLKTGSTTRMIIAPGPSAQGGGFALPVIDSGYFETATNELLQADVGTTGIYLTVFYLTYTP